MCSLLVLFHVPPPGSSKQLLSPVLRGTLPPSWETWGPWQGVTLGVDRTGLVQES